MKIDASSRRKSEAPRSEYLAVGCCHYEVEPEPLQLVQEFALVELDGLVNPEALTLGECLDGRGLERKPPARRAVRLGYDADNFMTGMD